jgi:hypothetical protein
VTVKIKGLRDLDRALGKADKDLRKDLRGRLKAVAMIVATGARAKAEAKGLRQSGDLIRGIKPYALTGKAGVRSGAMHRGYNYPARVEYEGGNRGPGPRATLNPAYEESKAAVLVELERLLDDFADNFEGRP